MDSLIKNVVNNIVIIYNCALSYVNVTSKNPLRKPELIAQICLLSNVMQ